VGAKLGYGGKRGGDPGDVGSVANNGARTQWGGSGRVAGLRFAAQLVANEYRAIPKDQRTAEETGADLRKHGWVARLKTREKAKRVGTRQECTKEAKRGRTRAKRGERRRVGAVTGGSLE
jgi:hypothetical protein